MKELLIIEKYNSKVYAQYGGTLCVPPEKFVYKFIDDRGEFRMGSAKYKDRVLNIFMGNDIIKPYEWEKIVTELMECDPSATEITIIMDDGMSMKVHARTAFLKNLYQESAGGSTQNKKGSKKEKSPKAAPRWTSTGRKVTTKDGRSRVAFRNAAGELRVRKVTVGKDGKRTTRYISF
jgi:hypothetical protein